MHGLSDLLPSRIHLTVPVAWMSRRLRWPSGVAPHYADLEDHEFTWLGEVPATEPARTLNDCAGAGVQREKLAQARREGLARGLFAKAAIQLAAKYLDGTS
jgi:predicted transcriptional regulator of viral defense system